MSDLPRNMVVQCPIPRATDLPGHKRCVFIPITQCDGCPHLQAVGVVNDDERIPWDDRHRIICTYPRQIAIHEVANG